MKNSTQGVVLAGMVAGFFAVGCAATPTTQTQSATFYKCTGDSIVTGPKTSDCSGHGNAAGCQGTNDCKGKGWKKMTKADCEAKGGTVNEVTT